VAHLAAVRVRGREDRGQSTGEVGCLGGEQPTGVDRAGQRGCAGSRVDGEIELLGGNGPAEEEPLAVLAAPGEQRSRLLLGLDPLTDDVQPEGAAHPDRGLDDDPAPPDRVVVRADRSDEGPVELQFPGGSGREQVERGEPRSEVVESDLDPQR
jgi:hypothetical protein